nr:putative transposase domain protein [Rhodococcus sp. JVH1]
MYLEAEKEDDLRKVGYSKERRVDPQIVVGLLVDRTGFPLEIGCYEGNAAETHTIVPIVRQFQARHDLEGVEMVVAADAGMLSAANLAALDRAGLKFIVGSRVTKAPGISVPISIGTVQFSKMGRSSTRSRRGMVAPW